MSLFGTKFWVGMMVGSAVGVLVYRCAQTEKAKQWKADMCKKMKEMRGKAADAGEKVADAMADKAQEAKEKVHSFARDMKS